MKKRIIATLLSCSLLLAVFSGCSEGGTSPANSSPPSASASGDMGEGDESLRFDSAQLISVYTSTPGGGMYNIAAAVAPIWDEKVNVTMSIGPGGSYSNFIAVYEGEADIGFSHQCMHYWAERGEEPFEEAITGLSTITTLFPATVQGFTLAKNTSIQTMADLADKRIGLGAQGSALNIFVLDYLKTIYGITPETIAANGGSISYMSDSDMSAALGDGIIDIGFGLGTYPKTSIQELENSPGIRFIPFGDDLQKYLDINTGWNSISIPAGTYVGQEEDYLTATSWAVMTVKDDLDEELVYRITRSLWENIETAAESCFEIDEFMKLETAIASIDAAPLHPGAERYYREIGIIQ